MEVSALLSTACSATCPSSIFYLDKPSKETCTNVYVFQNNRSLPLERDSNRAIKLDPHQITADFLSSNIYYYGNSSTASTVKQQAADYQPVFQTEGADSQKCNENREGLLPRAVRSLTGCNVGVVSLLLCMCGFFVTVLTV